MISVHRFTYNGYSSVDFDLITCLSFDDTSGATSTFLNRDAVASETWRGELKRVSNYKYNETLAPVITLIKKNFGDFSLDEQRKINRWLTSKNTPSFITIYHDDSNVISYEILGGFTSVETYKLGSGRVVGYQCTFESVSPFAFSPLQTISKDVSNPVANTLTINIDSDDESTVYPRVTIQQKDSVLVKVDKTMITNNKWVVDDWMDGTVYYYEAVGEYYYNKHNTDGSVVPTVQKTAPTIDTTSVIIKNTHTDEHGRTQIFKSRVTGNTRNEKIILDGANKVVNSSAINRTFGNNFDWNFIPMYNGKNQIEVIGNCIVTLEWRTVIKCGDM
jgi:hypothetical protein